MTLPINIPQIDTFSDEELIALCLANPDLSIERDESGQLFINMSPTFALTSSNNSELNAELTIWNRKTKLGKVFDSNSAFILPDSSMRGPDVAWITKERWDALRIDEKKSFPKLAPDFVVELASESDNLEELKLKMAKWIQNGVRLAWLVNPKNRETYIYRQNKEVEVLRFSQKLLGEDVLINFEVVLDDILEL
ncbi:MAG: Uma2 family endonuclease [Spirosomaceae bacterium]|jgi:Uma2 family endonuclease|nr:Uma2 family endonuclease [Spirosomataceae bacterium]